MSKTESANVANTLAESVSAQAYVFTNSMSKAATTAEVEASFTQNEYSKCLLLFMELS